MQIKNIGSKALTFRRVDTQENITIAPMNTAEVDSETATQLLRFIAKDRQGNVLVKFEEVV